MAKLTKNFISLVAVGSQNPQILNIDFLKINKILPLDDPAFAEIAKGNPPTEFVSLPGFAKLVLNKIEFFVDIGRFQIKDNAVAEWDQTKILLIAKRYFAVLPHTPLSIIGVNFNYLLDFDSPEAEQKLVQVLVPDNATIKNLIPSAKVDADCNFSYNINESDLQMTVSINHSPNVVRQRVLNFNLQFAYKGLGDFDKLVEKLPQVAKECDEKVSKL